MNIFDPLAKLIFHFSFSESNSKAMYKNMNCRIEKCSRTTYFFIAQVTPILWVGPTFVHSIFAYFSTNLGNDALELPLLEWCV